MKYILPLIFIAICFIQAEKRVGGTIDRNTRWNADEGPFIIESDIVITEGTRLTIAPGTRIIVDPPPLIDPLPQLNHIDSTNISIKVEGVLICIGRRDKRISFTPRGFKPDQHTWYGIVFNRSEEEFTEIAYTDITGAYCGITAKNSSPLIRTTLLEYNHIGISFTDGGSAHIYNCNVARNFVSGIIITNSNPLISNSIIAFNHNTGVQCDGVSKIKFEYNCIWGNGDGDLLDCDPEFGLLVKRNKNGDSVDLAFNIYKDPIFDGSVSDSLAAEKDISLPTKISKVRDVTIAEIIQDGTDSSATARKTSSGIKYTLSGYSPCTDAGNPAKKFHDLDGSKNDMGIGGGPEFFAD